MDVNKSSENRKLRRIAVGYDELEKGRSILEKLQPLVMGPQAATLDALVIGDWGASRGLTPQKALDFLVAQHARLPRLTELFVGDIEQEESEISWITQGNYSGVFAAFPQLERLHIKGADSLVLSGKPLRHAQLKALTIECGGLPKSVIRRIATADLPRLEYLNLYIGVDEYGFDGTLEDLRPFMHKERFPQLRYLALADSELADDIARAIAEASVLDILETLDLSKGTLSDKGGAALLASSKIRRLKRLDLHHHYLSREMMNKLRALGPSVDVSAQQDEDEDDGRYPAVTE